MKDLLRTLVAAVVGAVVALAVVVGQPALAHQVDKAKAHKITSAQIKNHTIKPKDLNAKINGSLAKGATALQSIPDGSVTTTKLGGAAVTTPKLADGSVNANKLLDGSVTSSKIAGASVTNAKLAPSSVNSGSIQDFSLHEGDVTSATGTANLDFPSLAPAACSASGPQPTGVTTTGALLLVSQPTGVAGNISITVREDTTTTALDVVLCNVGNATFDPPPASYHWAVITP